MNIEINVFDKVAILATDIVAVCGNSDYVIQFNFDSEWDDFETKTARFKWNKSYQDVVFTGNSCNMPVINDTWKIEIGVFAGNLHTTTPAILPTNKSILCGSGNPADPSPDVYEQLVTLLDSKANLNQGTANAGKYWMVGTDGSLILSSGGGSGSSVSYTTSRTSGSEVGTLTIDGTDYKLYAPTPYTEASIRGFIESYGYATSADIPTTLPNPNKLTLTGAASAEYDGSAAVSVAIPKQDVAVVTGDDDLETVRALIDDGKTLLMNDGWYGQFVQAYDAEDYRRRRRTKKHDSVSKIIK